MKSHHVTLTEPVSKFIETQISCGRFKDFSAAMQEAAWNYFCNAASVLEEYGVTAAEVEKSYQKNMAEYRRDEKAGKLKEFKL